MRELTLRVAATEVEEVLDAVLPALPGGLHVREEGTATELKVLASRGAPSAEELRALAGRALLELSETEVSEDWRERRLARYRPLVVADRFLVRADWAPSAEDPAFVEIVLTASPAFGSGVHPTTSACIAVLAEIPSLGSLLDCGCGSGILSIAAAKLGWSPVIAVDLDQGSVEATRANARRNGIEIEARAMDVTAARPPAAEVVVANVPPTVQLGLARQLRKAPALAILSGFKPAEIAKVASAWEALGLKPSEERQANEWSLLLMR